MDNDLSPLIAKALELFDFDIQTVDQALGRPDIEDEEIIPWLGRTATIWITHDKRAKRQHDEALKYHRATVLWVAGDKLSNWDQLKIVVRVIDVLIDKVRSSRGAIHFRATRKGGPTPTIFWAEHGEDRPKEGRAR